MRIDVETTPEDFAAFSRFATHRATASGRGLLRFVKSLLLAAVCGVPLAVFFKLLGLDTSPGGILFGAVYSIGFILLSSHLNHRKLRPLVDGTVCERKAITLSDEGLRMSSPRAECLFRWPAVQCIGETQQHIFVMVDVVAGVILPKRCFSSATEAQGWLDELRRRTGK